MASEYLILLVCSVVGVTSLGSYKNVTVMGQLGCGDRSVPGVKVELWERDRADPDDLLNSTSSGPKGNFHIFGQENEIGNIEPYLKITHSCDNGVIDPRCTITDEYKIPKEFVGKVYDMGIVSLNIVKKKHKKHCNN